MPVTSQGRHYNQPEAALRAELASAARTTSGQSSAFNIEDARALEATLAVTANAGTTPTLDLKLQVSQDGSTWDDVAAFPQKTGNGTHKRMFSTLGASQGRWVWAIAGTTPSFTFGVTVKAVVA
jgi:hypothetical protein